MKNVDKNTAIWRSCDGQQPKKKRYDAKPAEIAFTWPCFVEAKICPGSEVHLRQGPHDGSLMIVSLRMV